MNENHLENSFSAAQAYWNQRFRLVAARERIQAVHEAVHNVGAVTRGEFTQLVAAVLEFRPDRIVEIGRPQGGAACAFTEAANQLDLGPESVVSYPGGAWVARSLPRLEAVVSQNWFIPLRVEKRSYRSMDARRMFADADRVLLCWHVHDPSVTEFVLGGVIPKLAGREHMAIGLGVSDPRRTPKLTAFAAQNGVTLESAGHSMRSWLCAVPPRLNVISGLLGDMFSSEAGWFYFSLDGKETLDQVPSENKDSPLRGLLQRAFGAA